MSTTPEKMPQLIEDCKEIRAAICDYQRQGKKVGLVPTMGALHEGHLSLLDAAKAECDIVATTIFVNPTQFNNKQDLEVYPRDLQSDLELLASKGCDLVFAPTVSSMYGSDFQTHVEVGAVAEPFEGANRPGHFKGVATIVLKLFNLLPADAAFFGQKDYQQTLVIRQMVRDFNLPIQINICPIIREPDGLAMSSRNARLSTEERQNALVLSKSLTLAAKMVSGGEKNTSVILKKIQTLLDSSQGVQVEYVAIVNEGTMQPMQEITGPVVAIIAASVGETRLIDNRILV